jgi:DNA-binding transcriptional MerR regulator
MAYKLDEKRAIFGEFSTGIEMQHLYPTKLVQSLTRATSNQLKYWVRTGLVCPARKGKICFYSFKDVIKLRVLVSLKSRGLSLQKIRIGIENLSAILPDTEPLSRMVIYTDGVDMIVAEKGRYFSAITRQRYMSFDTEQIGAELVYLQQPNSHSPAAADSADEEMVRRVIYS